MHAAVVSSFDQPPQYAEFPDPLPQNDNEMIVDVIATGLHPRVRSQADGSHYTSSEQLPLVPGIDGVGRSPDGALRYFVLPDTTVGAMAERTVIDRRRSIALPDGADPVRIAAAMNPAMASWVALRRRITFEPGQSVLVLGATGNAGQLAVQVAKHLGASSVVAAGRDPERLEALLDVGADRLVSLVGSDAAADLGRAGQRIDVVLDFLWGEPTTTAMVALATRRADAGQLLTWVEIGSLAGRSAAIPSAALRATRLQIVGSGQGSVPTAEIAAELSDLAQVVDSASLQIASVSRPLREVTAAWQEATDSRSRIVIRP
jgi:NADPH:quinone reductase-like Zn-dependent oxidoreductase